MDLSGIRFSFGSTHYAFRPFLRTLSGLGSHRSAKFRSCTLLPSLESLRGIRLTVYAPFLGRVNSDGCKTHVDLAQQLKLLSMTSSGSSSGQQPTPLGASPLPSITQSGLASGLAHSALPSAQQTSQSTNVQPQSTHSSSTTPLSSPTSPSSGSAPLPTSIVSQAAHASSPQPRPSAAQLASTTPADVNLSHQRDVSKLLSILVATALFVLTTWFARATFTTKSSARTSQIFKHVFHIDIGDTLTILAILSSVMTRGITIALDSVFESIQWSLISQSKGASILSILAVSQTTGVMGTAGILVGKTTDLMARYCASAK